jgi:hypothetical protein
MYPSMNFPYPELWEKIFAFTGRNGNQVEKLSPGEKVSGVPALLLLFQWSIIKMYVNCLNLDKIKV